MVYVFDILQPFHHGHPPHHIIIAFLFRCGTLLPHIMPFLGRSLSWKILHRFKLLAYLGISAGTDTEKDTSPA